jgi:hypothetical protein
VFNQWRSSGSWRVPPGYSIDWTNVIAANAGGKPCIFQTGEYKGYFGSLTALKNGIKPAEAGECKFKDQLDQRFIPAIVLRGKNNPLKTYGGRKGDLVLAVNPKTGVVVAAIIGDTGDGKRIGEGSVALNMKLLGVKNQPKTYPTVVKQLDTGKAEMIVAVLPGTATYRLKRPYTAENIRDRVEAWAKDRGYESAQGLSGAMKACAKGL